MPRSTFHVKAFSARVGVASLLCIIGALLLLAGCSSPTSPGERTLRVGRYSFTASHGRNEGFSPDTFVAVMRVTASSPDAISVQFDGPKMRVATAEAVSYWNNDAYRVVGDPIAVGNLYLRLSRDGDAIRCSGVRTYIVDRSYSIDVTCSVAYLGP